MKKLLVLLPLVLGACVEPSAEHDQQVKTNEALSEMNRQIGMPNIRNFQEKKLLKLVLDSVLRQLISLEFYHKQLNLILHPLLRGINQHPVVLKVATSRPFDLDSSIVISCIRLDLR